MTGMCPVGRPMIEEIRFKVWLHVYHWRRPLLVILSSTLIIIGFFFMMTLTQIEEQSTSSKRSSYETKAFSEKVQDHMKKRKHQTTARHPLPTVKSLRLLINEPHFCLERTYLFLIAITSSPDNIEKRMAIRSTWGNSLVLNATRGAIVFLLGKIDNNMKLQKQIYEESMSYRDMIQGDFIDTYKNLTLKALMGLKWFSSYCHRIKFFMKTDDDIFVNIEQLSHYLEQRQRRRHWIVGCVKTHVAMPIKMRKGKGMPVYTLPTAHPTFVAGAGYVISNDTVELLVEACQRIKRVPVEDAFVTGHCAKAIGIKPEHNSRFSCGEAVRDYCILSKTMFTGHHISAEKQEEIWNYIHDPKVCK